MSRLNKRDFYFPDPRHTLEDGLLCVGGDLCVETLKEAYSKGIFPWPEEGYPLLWFSPPKRGVLDFKDFHISKSFKKFLRQTEMTATWNHDFEKVIAKCAKQPRPGQTGTWILPAMEKAYIDFHKAGYAQSIEVWLKGKLVGGMYGVLIDGVFSGESMFYDVDNASKFALYKAIEFLKAKGISWMDIQMVTPNLEAFGGKYIDREEFLQRLAKTP